MPYGDRTGPRGLGPMTGRGLGYWAGHPVPGYMNFGPGFGCWYWGRGWRHWYWATGLPGWIRQGFGYPAFGIGPMPYSYALTPKEEMALLKEQAEVLRKQLEEVTNRISTLEKAQTQETE
ncbi:MAG: DUF5320 domain-containing protein [bacterium]